MGLNTLNSLTRVPTRGLCFYEHLKSFHPIILNLIRMGQTIKGGEAQGSLINGGVHSLLANGRGYRAFFVITTEVEIREKELY